jgi:peptide/nickel transport system ATP-binding protein
VAIARAFATNPKLLVADEPVSALDVSIQASILNLLTQLQLERGTSTLLISHDITAVGYLADVVAVMYLGRIMERTDARELFTPPMHPYTEALISAIPSIDPKHMDPNHLEGELPSPTEIPTGCPFYARCPRSLGEICQIEEPPWQELPNGKRIYCHIPGDELLQLQEKHGLENPSCERVNQ